MRRLTLLAVATLAAPLAHASTIQSSLSGFAAAAGSTVTTATIGTVGAPVTSVRLPGGNGFTLDDPAAAVDQPGFGVLPFANGYTGQVIDSSGATETLTFTSPLSSFGLTLQPDVAFVPTTGTPVTFNVRLGDGTVATIAGTYPGGAVQFIGFTGGPQTSLTIAATGAPDFAFGQFLTAATAIPEPTTLALLSTALLTLRLRRKIPTR